MEVNEIFQDLAVMVHEQGLQIDNIESNVGSAAEAVQEGIASLFLLQFLFIHAHTTLLGVVHLEKADEYQQKA